MSSNKILLDNAYSSWSTAIHCCDAILNGMATLKYRKDFVSNLQNAVELFMKQIMLDKNDFRVVTVKKSGEDGEPAKSYYSATDLNTYFKSVDDDVMKKFYSLEFNEIITLHRKILDGYFVGQQTFKEELELLARLRNSETHFYIKPDRFLPEDDFIRLYNFMVDFYSVLEHFDLLPYWGDPSMEHKNLEFKRTKLVGYTYEGAVRNAPIVKTIAAEAGRIVFGNFPGGSAFSIANAIYSCAENPFKESFDEIWAYVEMLDQFGMIDIDVDTFPVDSVDETYCARPGVETDYFIKINL